MNDMVAQPDIPNRMQRRVSKTRGRLLRGALSVFAEVGTEAATIEMITQRADLGKGTFYRHFADKSEIISVLVEQCVGNLLEAISQAVHQPHSLQEALDGLVTGHVEFYLSRREEYIMLLGSPMLLKLNGGLAPDVEQLYEDYLCRIEELLRPFLPNQVDDVKLRCLACAIAGFVSGFLSLSMTTMDPQAVKESIEAMRIVFLGGVIGLIERSLLHV
jgi:AcrR family transcriptional regulator